MHDSGHTPPDGLEMAVEQTARPQMTVKRTLRPETGMNSIQRNRAVAKHRADKWNAAPPPNAEWREPIQPSIQIKVEGAPSDSQ